MSFQLMAWASEQKTGSASRKAVLLALANRANHDTGLCCPKVERIAEETELGEQTVRRAIAGLVDDGFITRTRTKRKDGTWNVYHYSFQVSDLTKPPVTVTASPPVTDTGQEPRSSSSNQEEIATLADNATLGSQEIVAAYVDAFVAATGTPAPKEAVGMVARRVGGLISEGIDPDVVLRAVGLMMERRLHPTTLPTLIHEAAVGPRQTAMRYGRGMTTQQILDATKGRE